MPADLPPTDLPQDEDPEKIFELLPIPPLAELIKEEPFCSDPEFLAAANSLLGDNPEEGYEMVKELISSKNNVVIYAYPSFQLELVNKKITNDLYTEETIALIYNSLGLLFDLQNKYNEAFKYTLKAAELNDENSADALFMYYMNGKGCQKNEQKALKWLRKSAEWGNSDALFKLGILYRDGELGFKKNQLKAFQHFQKAANKNHADAAEDLSICYLNGKGCKKDKKKALEWIKISAKLGNNTADFKLGLIYGSGYLVSKIDLKKSFEYLESAAIKGHSEAAEYLGVNYMHGRGCKKNEQKALEWLQKSAEWGNDRATFRIGLAYHLGALGLKKDKQMAFKFLNKSALNNHSKSAYLLGMFYMTGEGCIKNDKKALKWFNKSAKLKCENALLALGLCYKNGLLGIQKNTNKAFDFFQKAVLLDEIKAAYHIAQIYFTKKSKYYDLDKAIYYMEMAARSNIKQSAKLLSRYYITRHNKNRNIYKGDNRDLVEAEYWALRANIKDAKEKDDVDDLPIATDDSSSLFNISSSKIIQQDEDTFRFYYFVSAKTLKLVIESGLIRATQLSNSNDAMEYVPAFDTNQMEDKQRWKSLTRSNEPLCICLSARYSSPTMWGHYGESHQGACLVFELPIERSFDNTIIAAELNKDENNPYQSFKIDDKDEDDILLAKVLYAKYRPQFITATEAWLWKTNAYRNAIYKSMDWSYEQEYRLLINSDKLILHPSRNKKTKNEDKEDSSLYFDGLRPYLTAVILGVKSPYSVHYVSKLIKETNEKNKDELAQEAPLWGNSQNYIEVIQAVYHPSDYRIVAEPFEDTSIEKLNKFYSEAEPKITQEE